MLSFFQEEIKTKLYKIYGFIQINIAHILHKRSKKKLHTVHGFNQIGGELHRARPRYNIFDILSILKYI